MNVAIPVSLIGEDELGQLKFTMFIQVSNGYLSKEHLNLAIKASKGNTITIGLSCRLLEILLHD